MKLFQRFRIFIYRKVDAIYLGSEPPKDKVRTNFGWMDKERLDAWDKIKLETGERGQGMSSLTLDMKDRRQGDQDSKL